MEAKVEVEAEESSRAAAADVAAGVGSAVARSQCVSLCGSECFALAGSERRSVGRARAPSRVKGEGRCAEGGRGLSGGVADGTTGAAEFEVIGSKAALAVVDAVQVLVEAVEVVFALVVLAVVPFSITRTPWLDVTAAGVRPWLS